MRSGVILKQQLYGTLLRGLMLKQVDKGSEALQEEKGKNFFFLHSFPLVTWDFFFSLSYELSWQQSIPSMTNFL